MSLSMVGAVPGTFIVIEIVVLGVVLLAYAVYFLFFKKNLGSEDASSGGRPRSSATTRRS
jgi:hypothetical protein